MDGVFKDGRHLPFQIHPSCRYIVRSNIHASPSDSRIRPFLRWMIFSVWGGVCLCTSRPIFGFQAAERNFGRTSSSTSSSLAVETTKTSAKSREEKEQRGGYRPSFCHRKKIYAQKYPSKAWEIPTCPFPTPSFSFLSSSLCCPISSSKSNNIDEQHNMVLGGVRGKQ